MTQSVEKDAPETFTREDVARAWDEGFRDAVKWNGAPMVRNPYRVIPPESTAPSEPE